MKLQLFIVNSMRWVRSRHSTDSDVRGTKNAFVPNASHCNQQITTHAQDQLHNCHEPVQQPRLPDSERRTLSFLGTCRSFRRVHWCERHLRAWPLPRDIITFHWRTCHWNSNISSLFFTFHSTICYQQHSNVQCALCTQKKLTCQSEHFYWLIYGLYIFLGKNNSIKNSNSNSISAIKSNHIGRFILSVCAIANMQL